VLARANCTRLTRLAAADRRDLVPQLRRKTRGASRGGMHRPAGPHGRPEIYRQSHDDVHFLRAICALAMVPGFSEPFLRAETGL
jgi:hypothetical protein